VESDPLTVDLDRIAVDDRGTADNVGTGGCCRCKDYGSGEQPDREAHGSWSFSAFDRVDDGHALFLRQVRQLETDRLGNQVQEVGPRSDREAGAVRRAWRSIVV
jgi:hypothetical protein